MIVVEFFQDLVVNEMFWFVVCAVAGGEFVAHSLMWGFDKLGKFLGLN